MVILKNKRIGIGIILLAILLGAAFFRFENLGRQSYWMDEGFTVNAIISGLENGTKKLSEKLDSKQTYFCPTYCYPTKAIITAFTAFYHPNLIPNPAVAFRALSAFAGLLVVGLFWLIAKKAFKDDRIALLAAFFTAFSYWQIAWSRQARWYTLYELFFWLALFCAYLAARRLPRAIYYVLPAALFATLATLTHKLGFGLFVIIAVYLFVSYLPSLKGNRKNYLKIITAALTLAAVVFLIGYFDNFRFFRGIITRVNFYYELPYYLNFYLKNYWYLIILSLYGFFSASKEHKNIYWLVFLPIIGYLFALGFLTNIVHYRYLFAPIAGLFITGAAGAVAVIKTGTAPLSRIKGAVPFVAVVIVIIFFLSGEGIIKPQPFYFLESDSTQNPNRPYWGYTPQPNFNKAYEYIKTNLKPDDIVIASHPQFNKIFLNQPGYWIKYDYLGLDKVADTTRNNKEYYVGAETINNLNELAALMSNHHGYITYDFMSQDGRIPPETIAYIKTNATQVLYDKINAFSQIWVYKF